MRYLSVCSGIEAATAAWHPLGWEPVAFSEVDAFPSAVLKHHYPSVPNWGDMTKFQEWPDADVDVLVGGTPCQSFSVAGLRKGLDDPRGSLMLVYLAIARRYRPRWLVWENVPGVLSADGGRAFGSLLGGLAELGYGFAYRVLDAQYFGVAQRRKRVFVVGHLGDWRRAAAVLFERESLSGHPAPRRASGQVAPTELARRAAGGGFGTDFDCDGGLIARRWPADVAPTLDAHFGDKQGQENQHINGGCGLFVPAPPIFATSGQANTAFTEDIALALNATHEQSYIAGTLRTRRPGETGQGADVDLIVPVVSPALNTASGGHHAPDTRAYAVEVTHSLRAEGFDAGEDGTGRGTPLVPTIAPCLTRNYGKQPDSSDTNAGPMLIPVAHAFDARQSDVIQYGDKTGPLDTDGSSIGVMTLAIRGRSDGAQLEVREDGTSNAILTPSGGRGGIGVGAVAFSAKDYGADAGDIAPTLRAGGHTGSHANGGVMPAVAQHMAVRRLTPRECERLQGFPDDTKTITIRVCRSEDERRALALSAAKSSVAPKLEPSRHVAVDVRIDLERQHLQLRSLGKSNLSVSFADAASSSPLSIPLADFARLVAVTTSTLARETRTGEVASLLTINRSSAPWDGSVFVHLCGREIEELANDAEQFTTALSRSTKFITSEAGRSSQNSEQTLRTLCSCVAAVIASFIPEAIRAVSSFDLRLTTISGYTLIPYRGKPAADGPRYKALGNSMAVPVMRWIGERIAQVEAV